MNYKSLNKYISQEMRMSHIYQPVMIKAILKASQPVKAKAIASHFLEQDLSQIEYYEKVTKLMPAKVLKKNGIIKELPEGYALNLNSELLTKQQRNDLIALCDSKISEYQEKRGMGIWEHRRKGLRPISGSIRYEVLKRAGDRCELCGANHDIRGLEVDHIIPRNMGGTNIIDNYQALCYKCNANKRDTDNTDFREWKVAHKHREHGCIFCKPEKECLIAESELVYVRRDRFPVTEGHALIIPKRHVASLFDLFDSEIKACMRMIKEHKQKVEQSDLAVEGFNVGVNVNEVAGQSIFHCHWHLIPRRKGDVPNPRGGVRHIIPGKGNY